MQLLNSLFDMKVTSAMKKFTNAYKNRLKYENTSDSKNMKKKLKRRKEINIKKDKLIKC